MASLIDALLGILVFAIAIVDAVTLPDNAEFPPALKDFFELSARPPQEALLARLDQLGLNTDSDLERRLPERVREVGREIATSS
jgi:hypothetical protein